MNFCQAGRKQFALDLTQKGVPELFRDIYTRDECEHEWVKKTPYILPLHESGSSGLKSADKSPEHLLLQRAIGVIYKPQTELYSHCSYTRVEKQFDLLLFTDCTSAVTPMDEGEPPALELETYPAGL